MPDKTQANDFVLMTKEGHARLSAELIKLRSEDRYQVAQRIEEARSFGDLSENAEYAAAKEDQAKLEGKIMRLEYQLSRAKVVDSSSIDTNHVALGTTVTIEDLQRKKNFTYSIVGPEESNPRESRISSVSPVGQALLGKTVNEVVQVKVPKGIRKLRIIDIKLA